MSGIEAGKLQFLKRKKKSGPKWRTGMNHEIFLLLYNWNCEKRGAWIFIETEGKSWCCRLPTPRDLLRKIKKYFSNATVLDLGRQIPRKRFASQWSIALSVGFLPAAITREGRRDKTLEISWQKSSCHVSLMVYKLMITNFLSIPNSSSEVFAFTWCLT